jgi:hypothetical protein
MPVTGTITVNGITDEELIKILEIKLKHKAMEFSPSQLQVQKQQNQPTRYNAATFTWQDPAGLEGVHQVLGMLLKKQSSES